MMWQVILCYVNHLYLNIFDSSIPKLMGSEADISLSDDTEAVSVAGLNNGLPISGTETNQENSYLLFCSCCCLFSL